MDDGEALLLAVLADPDADLPRLVYADWLEDAGDPDRAAFVRAQVELARTPAWEPFAVYCRHRRPAWADGRDWRATLPAVNPHVAEWHPGRAFRRGFGYALIVRDLTAFLADAPRLFDAAPVGELHLPTATLDEWRRFAAQPWLPRVRGFHFYSLRTPIEAVRALADAPLASGVEEIVFETASRPGMPEVLAGLLRSPLGRRLKRLALRSGPEAVDDLVDAFCEADPGVRLESFALATVALTGEAMDRLLASGPLRNLARIDLSAVPGGGQVFRQIPDLPAWEHLSVLRVDRSAVEPEVFTWAVGVCRPAGLRMLELTNHVLGYDDEADDRHAWSSTLDGLRSLRLRRCQVGNGGLQCLTFAEFWPNLVELDLRDNRINGTGAGWLHSDAVPVPPDLTALLLAGNPISAEAIGRLRDKFGDAVIFE